MAQPSRRWDGEPETEFDTRLFDLRDSGYTGPIDQDGYAVTEGEDARILRDTAAARGEDTSWWTGDDDRPPTVDQGDSPRWRVLLFAALLVVVVMVVLTHISHLRP